MEVLQQGKWVSGKNSLVRLDEVHAVTRIGKRIRYTMSSGASVVVTVDAATDYAEVVRPAALYFGKGRGNGR